MSGAFWATASRIALLLVFTLTGCRSGPQPSAPQTELERTLYFVERDQGGELHRISGAQAADPALSVAHVPWEHPVDVDSRVEVRLNKSMLGALGATARVPELASELTEQAGRLRRLLDTLQAMVAARAVAIDRWMDLVNAPDAAREPADAAFSAALVPLSALKKEFAERINECYPDEPATEERLGQIEDLVRQMGKQPAKSAELVAFLQADIDTIDQTARAMSEKSTQSFALRLEAFLVPGEEGKDPAAIHLEGYDSIADRRVKLTDRTGVKLSAADRKRLQALLASAKELADAANRVNEGEVDLTEALDGATSELGRKLDSYFGDLDALVKQLERRQSAKRWEATVKAAEEFSKELESLAQAQLDAKAKALAVELEQKLESWTEESGLLTALTALRDELRAFREAWRNGDSKIAALQGVAKLAEPAGQVLASLGKWRPLLDGARESLRDSFAAWKAEFPQLREQLEQRFDDSALAKSLEEWRLLARQARELSEPLQRYAGFPVEALPLAASFRVPEAIDMPLDDAPNTAIDLRKTDRRPGDRIELRATLIEDGAEKSSASTSFTARKLGWYGELVPAVVLTTADQLAGASDSAGFSASLSWMLRHGARPYDESGWAQSARWLGWGVGIHATLLNFDPDNDAEIGLGATLGLWDGRLLFGAGVNVLAESDNEGRYYYFAGSSLIPLLQALQAD